MRPGRKPLAEGHVESLSASELAKQRMDTILRSLRGELTVPQACEALGISESRFHAMRKQWLQESIELLEPRNPGRPRKLPATDPDEIDRLKQDQEALERELKVAQTRLEINTIFGSTGTAGPTFKKKKRPRRKPR